jgi:hypothetical protein
MSTTDTTFEIEINDDVTLRRDSMIEHAEHGPMFVDSVAVGPHEKEAELKAERSSIGLTLTGEQLREMWGETIAQDPFELHEPGTQRINAEDITEDGSGVEVDLTVDGPQEAAEAVYMHALDQTKRAIQAVNNGKEPSECHGIDVEIDWDKLAEELE